MADPDALREALQFAVIQAGVTRDDDFTAILHAVDALVAVAVQRALEDPPEVPF